MEGGAGQIIAGGMAMRQTAKFDYYYGTQADTYSFYRIPKVLFTSPFFKGLSCEAIMLHFLRAVTVQFRFRDVFFPYMHEVFQLSVSLVSLSSLFLSNLVPTQEFRLQHLQRYCHFDRYGHILHQPGQCHHMYPYKNSHPLYLRCSC